MRSAAAAAAAATNVRCCWRRWAAAHGPLQEPGGARRVAATSHVCAASKRQRGGAQSPPQQQPDAGAAPADRSGRQLVRSVRAMPLRIIAVSKANSPGANAFTEEWLDKLRRYTSAEIILLKPNPLKSKDPAVAKAAEAQKVLGHITPRDRVVLLDERGREVSSEGVAEMLAAAGDDGVPLVLCIGGPFGHGPAVVERADTSIRLSRLVLNHSVALVMLVEQLYRGWTILEGSPYHH
ncbi:MAG: hypothetical protein J3K34DRAFT_253141 [Monoraphidium minutum]|nr:MAG: hypothetical protein J3K34DRAFT_253141 [Monoraphidium minutum]